MTLFPNNTSQRTGNILSVAELSVADTMLRALVPLTVDQRPRALAMLRGVLGMARRRGPNRFFRQRDLARVRRVAEPGDHVTLDLASGKISITVAKPDEPQAASDLDQWLAKRAKDAHST